MLRWSERANWQTTFARSRSVRGAHVRRGIAAELTRRNIVTAPRQQMFREISPEARHIVVFLKMLTSGNDNHSRSLDLNEDGDDRFRINFSNPSTARQRRFAAPSFRKNRSRLTPERGQ
ncbi:protein of unknown function [Pararobbsia alpina]